MKKAIVVLGGLVALLLVSTVPAAAQTRVGGKFGLNFANVGGDLNTSSGRTALVFGAAMEFPLSRSIALETDLMLDMKGASIPVQGGEQTFKFSYITIPVLVKFVIPVEGANIRPQAYAGPYMALKMNCSFDQVVGNQNASGDCNQAGLDANTIDFGLTFGGGIEVGGVGPGAITADIRYSLGLSNVQGLAGSNQDISNRAFQILAGYMFPLGR